MDHGLNSNSSHYAFMMHLLVFFPLVSFFFLELVYLSIFMFFLNLQCIDLSRSPYQQHIDGKKLCRHYSCMYRTSLHACITASTVVTLFTLTLTWCLLSCFYWVACWYKWKEYSVQIQGKKWSKQPCLNNTKLHNKVVILDGAVKKQKAAPI